MEKKTKKDKNKKTLKKHFDYEDFFNESNDLDDIEKIKKKKPDDNSSEQTSKMNLQSRSFFPEKTSSLNFDAIFKKQP